MRTLGSRASRAGHQDLPSNRTCCENGDLKFTAGDPVVYAIAKVPIKLSILPGVISTSSTQFSTISQAPSASATEMDLKDLPGGGSSPTYGVASSPGLSSATHEAGPTQEASSGLGTGAKVGLGVGIPVGLLALAAIGACVWIRRKKQFTGVKTLPELHATTNNKDVAMNPHGTAMYRHELPSQVVATELPAQIRPYELPAHGGPHELPQQMTPTQ